jgi:hypothetical protein
MVCRIERSLTLAMGLCCASCAGSGSSVPQIKPVVAEPAPSAKPARVLQAASAPTAPSATQPVAAGPVDSPGFGEAMASLRPAAVAASLAALQAAPQEAPLYAQAALAYAATDVPAMTLIWGMTYQAMGGGAADAEVAKAIAKVLAERVTVVSDAQGRVQYNVRLAPGQMPARQHADGSIEAPIAHAFEGMFGATLMGFRPPWSVEEFYDVLSSWAGLVSTRGTPLDELLELNGWLVTLAKAGHLEAYCHRLLGAAFPLELKQYKAGHAKEWKALDEYSKGTALRPQHALMPDDLVHLK